MKRYKKEDLGVPYITLKNGKKEKISDEIWETILGFDSVQLQINQDVRKEKIKMVIF
jgi:hypothetical protein